MGPIACNVVDSLATACRRDVEEQASGGEIHTAHNRAYVAGRVLANVAKDEAIQQINVPLDTARQASVCQSAAAGVLICGRRRHA